MARTPGTRPARASRRRLLTALATGALAACLAPSGAGAARLTVGSPLSAPATLDTASDLSYQGVDTQVPASPEAPNGVVHTAHYGADTALWNAQAGSAMPAAGQALQIRLEGCAVPSAGGPAPLTQIHFQSVSPLPGGGAKVNLSSQAFDLPVCGVGGASGSTVSTYEPVNLCVNQGDYVAFNDEGGFVEHAYQSGVPYRVIGSVAGSTLDSFIRGGGTNNGDVFSPSDRSTMDGFATSPGKEVMLQVTLGTGPDARYACPGGSKDAPTVYAPISVHRQTDGVNRSRIVSVAVYCRLQSPCAGSASLSYAGKAASVGPAKFALTPAKTSHLPIRVTPRVMKLIRRRHGLAMSLTVTVGSTTVTQSVVVKIL